MCKLEQERGRGRVEELGVVDEKDHPFGAGSFGQRINQLMEGERPR